VIRWFSRILISCNKFIKELIEDYGNSLELLVWQNRQFIFFVGIVTLLGSLIVNYCRTYEFLNNLELEKLVGLFTFLIPYFIFLHIFPNFFNGKNLLTRLFSLLPYFWVWFELVANYFDVLTIFLEDLTPVFQKQFVALINPWLQMFTNLPGSSLGISNYLIFILFFFGIGRNRSTFQFFIRYHFIQAILFSVLIGFETHLFTMLLKVVSTVPEIWSFFGFLIFFCNSIFLVWSALCVLLGRETNFLFFDEAIQYHTGKKEDENIDPFLR
jgi:hypothetical protein